MKKNRSFSILLITILVIGGVALQFTTPASSVADTDINSDQQSMHNTINQIPSIDNSDSQISSDLGLPEIKIDQESEETNKFSSLSTVTSGIHSWGSIDTLATTFPEKTYPDDVSIRITDDNKVQSIIQIEGSMDFVKQHLEKHNIDFVNYLPKSNIIVANIPISSSSTTFDNKQIVSPVESLSSLVSVKTVEPDFVMSADFVPNDPSWSDQWGPIRIGMETAWDTQTGSSSVTVAVLDTGIDYSHPDLSDNYSPAGYDFVNDDSDPMDNNGHGTHVAGTIAATINNGVGIAGIGNVTVFAEKILDASGSGSYSWAAEAIYHATDQGADILSNSWGGSAYSSTLQDAVNYAVNNGALFIGAAGNDATNEPHYPAALDNVISVSSTDSSDSLSSFSNFGSTIDIAAPGSNILSTIPGDTYDYFSGTSMATPHVSGLAALIWSQFNTYNALQVENLLYRSAEDLGDPGYDILFGHGLINAATAMNGLDSYDVGTSISQTSYDPSTDTKTVTVGVENVGEESVSSVTVDLFQDNSVIQTQTFNSLAPGDVGQFDYSITHSSTNVINFTAYANPISSETYLDNNQATIELKNGIFSQLSDGEIIEGSLVKTELSVPDASQIFKADLVLNNNWISSISQLTTNEIVFFPVFQNGTNSLSYEFFWLDGSYSSIEVTIESTEVTSLLEMEIGDFIDWRYDPGDGSYRILNWDVSEYISPLKVNMSLYAESYNGASYDFIYSDLWAVVDLRNGYYHQTNFGWDFQRFSWLTGANSLFNNAVSGDHIPGFYDWNAVHEVSSDGIVGNYPVLKSASSSGYQMQTLKYSGVPLSLDPYSYLVDSSLYPTDSSIGLDIDHYNFVVDDSNPVSVLAENTGDLVLTDLSLALYLNGSSISSYDIIYQGTAYSDFSTIDLSPGENASIEFILTLTQEAAYNLSLQFEDTSVSLSHRVDHEITPLPAGTPILDTYSQPELYLLSSTGNTISWTFSDDNPANYSILHNSNMFVQDQSWTGGIPIEVNIDGLDEGIHEFIIIVEDADGYQNNHTITIEVVNIAPVLSESPVSITYEYNTTGNELEWTFIDYEAYNYTLYWDDSVLSTGMWENNETIVVSVDGLPVGTNLVTLVVSDTGGKTNSDSIFVNVTNNVPTLVSTSYTGDFTEGETGNTITWVFTDTNADNYEIYQDGSIVETGNFVSGTEITINLDYLEAGEYQFSITVYDSLGETQTETTKVVVSENTSITTSTSQTPTAPEGQSPDPFDLPFSFTAIIIGFIGVIWLRRRSIQ